MDDDPDNLGGGSDGVDVAVDNLGGENTPVEVVDKTGTDGAPPKKPVNNGASLTAEQIAEVTDRVVARRMEAARPREKAPEMTQAQIDQLLNPVRVSREDMAEIFGLEDATTISDKRLAKMQALLNATVKNSTSMAHVMQENRMRKLMEEAGPMQEFYQTQQAEQQKKQFFTAHPKLEKFPRIVQFAASQVNPKNPDGSSKTVKQAIDDIARIAKEHLKESNIDLDAVDPDDTGETTQVTGGGKTVPKMASMQSSGRSGAGPAKGGSNNPDADIYK